MRKALLVIDVQNDYFPQGSYPLWNTDRTLMNIVEIAARARAEGTPTIVIQHVSSGPGPFFNDGTRGAQIHPALREALPDAPVVVKHFADAFEQTNLEALLSEIGVTELQVCGMMTQNCVTHTAISKAAEKYDVSVLVDACTTVDEMLHRIALHALSTRVKLTAALA